MRGGVWGLPRVAEVGVPELALLCLLRGRTWHGCVPIALLWDDFGLECA